MLGLCRLLEVDSIANVAGILGNAQLPGRSSSQLHGVHLADPTTVTPASPNQVPASPGDEPADIALVRMLSRTAISPL